MKRAMTYRWIFPASIEQLLEGTVPSHSRLVCNSSQTDGVAYRPSNRLNFLGRTFTSLCDFPIDPLENIVQVLRVTRCNEYCDCSRKSTILHLTLTRKNTEPEGSSKNLSMLFDEKWNSEYVGRSQHIKSRRQLKSATAYDDEGASMDGVNRYLNTYSNVGKQAQVLIQLTSSLCNRLQVAQLTRRNLREAFSSYFLDMPAFLSCERYMRGTRGCVIPDGR